MGVFLNFVTLLFHNVIFQILQRMSLNSTKQLHNSPSEIVVDVDFVADVNSFHSKRIKVMLIKCNYDYEMTY